MKLEIMAKYVVVGDVLVKGAHKYTVVQVEKVAYTDLVNIVYKTMKTEIVRSMTVTTSEFVKVEQVDEVEEVEQTKEVEIAVVEFFAGNGAKRTIMQDKYGFFIKHRGMFEAVEKNDEGVWCHVGTTPAKAYRERNEHRYGKAAQAQETVEVAADPIEETNEVDENAVESVNLYIEHCKKEIETIKTLIVNAVDEDEKLFQKGRMKCKREELTFLENRKSEIISKQETALPAEPITKTPLMAKLIVVGDVISKGRHKYEVTNIKEYGDTITLFYSTIGTKNKIVRFMEVPPTHFITVYENVG